MLSLVSYVAESLEKMDLVRMLDIILLCSSKDDLERDVFQRCEL